MRRGSIALLMARNWDAGDRSTATDLWTTNRFIIGAGEALTKRWALFIRWRLRDLTIFEEVPKDDWRTMEKSNLMLVYRPRRMSAFANEWCCSRCCLSNDHPDNFDAVLNEPIKDQRQW